MFLITNYLMGVPPASTVGKHKNFSKLVNEMFGGTFWIPHEGGSCLQLDYMFGMEFNVPAGIKCMGWNWMHGMQLNW